MIHQPLCSDNGDCAGVGVEYNVGNLAAPRSSRASVQIHDADVFLRHAELGAPPGDP